MDLEYARVLEDLRRGGWHVQLLAQRQPLPDTVTRRYPWMPPGFRELAEQAKNVRGPDEKAWLLTVMDYSMASDSAYAWNEWERPSLEAGPA